MNSFAHLHYMFQDHGTSGFGEDFMLFTIHDLHHLSRLSFEAKWKFGSDTHKSSVY